MTTQGLDTAIQSLPPELREMILKEVITAKVKERKEKGWSAVHTELATIDTQKKIRCQMCGDRMVLSNEANALQDLRSVCADCGSYMWSVHEYEERLNGGCLTEEDHCGVCRTPRWGSFCAYCASYL